MAARLSLRHRRHTYETFLKRMRENFPRATDGLFWASGFKYGLQPRI